MWDPLAERLRRVCLVRQGSVAVVGPVVMIIPHRAQEWHGGPQGLLPRLGEDVVIRGAVVGEATAAYHAMSTAAEVPVVHVAQMADPGPTLRQATGAERVEHHVVGHAGGGAGDEPGAGLGGARGAGHQADGVVRRRAHRRASPGLARQARDEVDSVLDLPTG